MIINFLFLRIFDDFCLYLLLTSSFSPPFRYRDEDFDDSNMESNFQDVMREEIYSKKMGRLEDLEDMRMEEEELKRKAAMRKKRKL